MKKLKYKGYAGDVEFNAEDKVFHGKVCGVIDVITFESASALFLETEFQKSVDVYLEFCEKRGCEPERPVSGRFLVRMGPNLHRLLVFKSAQEKVSINTLIVQAIKELCT